LVRNRASGSALPLFSWGSLFRICFKQNQSYSSKEEICSEAGKEFRNCKWFLLGLSNGFCNEGAKESSFHAEIGCEKGRFHEGTVGVEKVDKWFAIVRNLSF